ncbi:hypothetical protein FOA43_004435 [Brettanomyces nanus]|uniref:Glutamine amidotransferase domain-containing protein n=1 Tax=Eeniella nana TaxID=13502 RepID=A0A875S7W5_EENNA|nr:uncharacterized protein FOA43_004435 [Brettanomyces nanus]QPG77038.1 hypothetical protein FOA43_004435 [Brettanomyces nanus]
MHCIAVLVLDTPAPGLSNKYGDFGDQGIEMMKESSLADDYQFDKFTTIGDFQVPSLEDLRAGKYDALYLSGSRCDSFDDSKVWICQLVQYLKQILDLQKEDKDFQVKLIGVCFGHQIIARAAGLPVGRNPKGWEVGLTQVMFNDEFHKTIQTAENHFHVVEMHQDTVLIDRQSLLPEQWVIVGSTNKCFCQGLYWSDHVLTFQGHPEFTTDYSNRLIESRDRDGGLPKEVCQEAMQRNRQLTNDSLMLSSIIMRFISN